MTAEINRLNQEIFQLKRQESRQDHLRLVLTKSAPIVEAIVRKQQEEMQKKLLLQQQQDFELQESKESQKEAVDRNVSEIRARTNNRSNTIASSTTNQDGEINEVPKNKLNNCDLLVKEVSNGNVRETSSSICNSTANVSPDPADILADAAVANTNKIYHCINHNGPNYQPKASQVDEPLAKRAEIDTTTSSSSILLTSEQTGPFAIKQQQEQRDEFKRANSIDAHDQRELELSLRRARRLRSRCNSPAVAVVQSAAASGCNSPDQSTSPSPSLTLAGYTTQHKISKNNIINSNNNNNAIFNGSGDNIATIPKQQQTSAAATTTTTSFVTLNRQVVGARASPKQFASSSQLMQRAQSIATAGCQWVSSQLHNNSQSPPIERKQQQQQQLDSAIDCNGQPNTSDKTLPISANDNCPTINSANNNNNNSLEQQQQTISDFWTNLLTALGGFGPGQAEQVDELTLCAQFKSMLRMLNRNGISLSDCLLALSGNVSNLSNGDQSMMTLSSGKMNDYYCYHDSSEIQKIKKVQGFFRGWLCRRRWKQIVQEYIRSPHAEAMRKRNNLVFRMVECEEEYVEQLNLLVSAFLRPFKMNASSSRPVLSHDELNMIFLNSETLLFLHQIFLKGLMARMESWPKLVLADLFNMLVPMLQIYQEFVRNHHVSMQVLAECKQRDQFCHILKRFEEKPQLDGRTIETFLTYPMHQVSGALTYTLQLN